jgi:hypothetical protein
MDGSLTKRSLEKKEATNEEWQNYRNRQPVSNESHLYSPTVQFSLPKVQFGNGLVEHHLSQVNSAGQWSQCCSFGLWQANLPPHHKL